MMNGLGMGGMGLAWIFWLLLIVGVVVLVVVLVTAFTRGAGGTAPTNGQAPPSSTGAGPRRAWEILEDRYARGEISTEEYQERRRILDEGDL
ncbi:SHOCT domain-containing protein [Crystallibacter degradans]|uniref:SHOCT domain-containing protein n=1 Tax=Crystallibacter degradans TaxID=2726743 RepID=UPI001473F77A|nr:SHOCT domain-containing protein [Arthrobacter sp. SF27]NMR32390.1 SHOCT domain-containing protein [Arthrobacter sp. SF27]